MGHVTIGLRSGYLVTGPQYFQLKFSTSERKNSEWKEYIKIIEIDWIQLAGDRFCRKSGPFNPPPQYPIEVPLRRPF